MCIFWAVIIGLVVLTAPAAGVAQTIPTLGPLDTTGRVAYFIHDGETGSSFRSSDKILATWALKNWERASEERFHFVPSEEGEALVHVYWVPAGGGQYGEMRPTMVRGRRGAAVYIRPDTNGLGPDIAAASGRDPLLRDTIVYLTCLHELGHALGLAHTSDIRDIMYFFGYGGDIPGFFTRYRSRLRSRDDMAGVSGLSEADVARVRALYPAR